MATDNRLNLPKSKTRDQLIKELDEKLRLNRGQFSNLASDTGSNVGFLTQQGRRLENPSAMGYQNPGINFDIPQAPSIPQIGEYQPMFEQQGQVLGDSDQLPENPSPEQMLQALFTAAWEPQLPSTEQLESLYQQTGQLYGVQNNLDGTITMNDGSVQSAPQGDPLPIASMADGTILWSDGFVRERPPEGLGRYLAGVAGLSEFLFGGQQAVTQDYMNYNPSLEPGSGYNMGTDFRTRDLSNRELVAPVPMQVVEIFYDDGTQWGQVSGHQGYGNSVLVMLPSGEYLRLSHLSNMGQFQVGDVLNPGDFIGTPGQTGNTNGEHLDVEYYNAQGQIDNPNNFKSNVQQYSMSSQILGESPYGSAGIQTQEQPQQTAVQPQIQTPMTDATTKAVDTVKAGIDTVKQLPQQAGQVLGAATEDVKSALEPMSPQRQALASGVETVGQATGLPEMYASEVASGAITPGMAVSKNIEERKPTGDNFDLGGSELFRGDIEGAKNIFLSNIDRAKNRLGRIPGQIKDEVIPQAYAGDGVLQDVGESLKDNLSYIGDAAKQYGQKQVDRFSDVTKQAGEGLKGLGQTFSSKLGNIFQKAPLSKVGGDRAVGEASPGGDQGAMSSLVNERLYTPANDIRDPFFKEGKDKQYSEYIRPDQVGDGALSLNIFGDEFYQGIDRIKNVFGGTFLEGQATEKYNEYQRAEEEKRRKEEEERNRQQPTLEDYLRMGKTAAQYYAETGQQSVADRAGGYENAARNYFDSKTDSYRQAPAATNMSENPQVVQRNAVTTAITAASQGKPYYSNTGNRILNYTPANANMSDAGTGLPVKAPTYSTSSPVQSNIFTRATSKIKNIFGR